MEATNGYSLVEAKNDIWYDIASGYGFCGMANLILNMPIGQALDENAPVSL